MTAASIGDAFVRVGRVDDVAESMATVVTVGRYDVALFRVGTEIHAYENACPHQGGPIADGVVEGATVTCPWHAWCFDLRTGTLTLGDYARLRRFATLVEDGTIFVARSPEPL